MRILNFTKNWPMKLGVAYNIWDGEELLIPSLRRMRPHVTKIVIVYSTVSNFGEHNLDLAATISQIEAENLADVIVQYFPKPGSIS